MSVMKKALAVILAAAMMFTTAVPAMAVSADDASENTTAVPSVSAEQMTDTGEYSDDKIIIVFDDSVKNTKIKSTIESEDADCVKITEASDDTKMAVAEIGEATSVEEAITALTENENVLYAQPNYKYEVMADYGTNDPYNNDDGLNQWYLTNIKAREAWKALKSVEAEAGLSSVKIAVIDTGADRKHEELQDVISDDSVRIEGGSIKPLEGDSSHEGHGTHVSGIIGAASDNGKGIAGVATGAGNDKIEIIAIDATSQDDPGEYFDTYGIVSAIDYAISKDVKVINMSLSGEGVDLVLEDAVEKAYEAGITVVVAAGNEGTDAVVTPSDHNEVISVCNTTKEDRRYSSSDWIYGESGSNFGQPKDISAPGTTILSTVPNGYENFTGTSMSAPMVSAAAAMVYMVNPDLDPVQVRNILCGTARDVEGAGYDYYTGYGVVNTLDAVNAALAASDSIPVDQIEFKEDSDYVKRLGVGERAMLEVLMTPANSLADVTWSSSDESVAAVDHKGKVIGISEGKVTITCSAGGAIASCQVQIVDLNKPQSVAVTNADEAAEMEVGDHFYLDTEIEPRYADKKTVYWKSKDMSVATVDELGLVTARGVGKTQILGYVYNSKYTDFDSLPGGGDPLTVIVDVKVYKSVESVKLITAPDKVKLGSTVTFKASSLPEDAVNRAVSWSSSNSAVAKIDKTTGKLTPMAPGKVTIKAYTANGKQASKKILIYTTQQPSAKYGIAAKSAGYNSVRLTWKGIENADGYYVCRAGKIIKWLGPDARSYTNTGLTCGKSYKYYVRAYYKVDGEVKKCTASAVKTVKPVPGKPTASTSAKKGKITVKWTKVKGASKYQIYKYSSTKKKYVRVATVSSSKVSYTDKKVKKGKKNYYKVRAYRTVNGKKVYGAFSKRVVRVAK